MPRIFFANPLFPPIRGGGAEHSLQELCTCLAGHGWSVKVCALGAPEFTTPERRPENFEINWFHGPTSLSILSQDEVENYITGPRFVRDMSSELMRLVPEARPDVLVANNAHCYASVIAVSKVYGIPSVLIVRDPQPICAIGHCIEGRSPESAFPCKGYLGTAAVPDIAVTN